MALMDSIETISAVVKETVQFIKKGGKEDEFCEDLLCVMLKTAYDRGREDVHSGQMNDLESYRATYSHTF